MNIVNIVCYILLFVFVIDFIATFVGWYKEHVAKEELEECYWRLRSDRLQLQIEKTYHENKIEVLEAELDAFQTTNSGYKDVLDKLLVDFDNAMDRAGQAEKRVEELETQLRQLASNEGGVEQWLAELLNQK